MLFAKRIALPFIVVASIAAVLILYWTGNITPIQIQQKIQSVGVWAPILYVLIYLFLTLSILPLTPLNFLAGVLFGLWQGLALATIAAILSGSIAFGFSRTWGRKMLTRKLSRYGQKLNTEISQGGIFYVFAICLLPILPYGLFSFAAGLTAIRFRDYLGGIALAMTLGTAPYVMLGSSGLQAVKTGDVLPLIGALGFIGIVVAATTWYSRRRTCKR